MSRATHPTATIFRKGVLENPEFRFNHVRNKDIHWEVYGTYGVHDCNGCFPMKRGYAYGDDCKKPPHPDDNKSFFFWRDYNEIDTYTQDNEDRDPEWLRSIWRLYVFDGTVNCWNGSTPNYNRFIDDWDGGYFEHSGIGLKVPIACLPLDEESPTDRDRRITYYRQHTCIWGLRDCFCSESGVPCNKVLTENYRNDGPCICGFGDYSENDSDSDSDDNYEDIDEWDLQFGPVTTTRAY